MNNDKFLKLTNAVYKILEYFPESDPLKNRAKDKALAIMDNLFLINGTQCLPAGRQGWTAIGDVFLNEKIKVNILEDIDILLGYLWLGKTQKWLNSVNYLIIANEYEKIRESIKPIQITIPAIQEKPVLSLETTPILKEQEVEVKQDIVLDDDGFIKETVVDLPTNNKPNIPTEINKGEKTIYSDRQNKIIEFLNKNGKAQVMDLQTVLPNITKRTIRRDLDDLLESGKIARLGDFNQVSYKIKSEQISVG